MPRLSAPGASAGVALVAKPVRVDLDKLDAEQMRHCVVFDADAHGKRAVAMIAHVEGLKIERSKKAILAGLYLSEIKATLGHGPFNAWCGKHLGTSKRTAERYMALAAKFARSTKLLLPELFGANQLTLDLQAQDSDGRAVLAKLDKFVGTSGLTDLMHKHDVIKQGGARPTPVTTPAGEGANDGAGEPTLEQAEAAARTAGLEAVETAHKALMNDVLWHDLTPENAALIDGKLKALTTQFHDRLLKLKHASAA